MHSKSIILWILTEEELLLNVEVIRRFVLLFKSS